MIASDRSYHRLNPCKQGAVHIWAPVLLVGVLPTMYGAWLARLLDRKSTRLNSSHT